jgi:hypothetical protein
VASVVGAPRAIAGSLALAAAFGVWATVTTPYEARHLVRRQPRPPAGELEDDVVIDLVAMEAESESASRAAPSLDLRATAV